MTNLFPIAYFESFFPGLGGNATGHRATSSNDIYETCILVLHKIYEAHTTAVCHLNLNVELPRTFIVLV
jgi:hypothetical protein